MATKVTAKAKTVNIKLFEMKIMYHYIKNVYEMETVANNLKQLKDKVVMPPLPYTGFRDYMHKTMDNMASGSLGDISLSHNGRIIKVVPSNYQPFNLYSFETKKCYSTYRIPKIVKK